MVLPPSLSITFLVAAIAPFLIGLLIGIIIKSALKLGVAIAVLLLILIGLESLPPTRS